MKVTIADYAGFCFGVERAIKLTEAACMEDTNVVTYGPIIHNPQVVRHLAEMGVAVKNSLEDITEKMTAVVRTHGVEKENMCALKTQAKRVVDATCPFVKNVQEEAAKLSEQGMSVVVVGEAEHPEVEGIVSYINGEYFIVSDIDEAKKLPIRSAYGVVAQTTQSQDVYDAVVRILKSLSDNVLAEKTICDATRRRQAAALELASKADMMIVIGGRNSANTTRLCGICNKICNQVLHIETVSELEDEMFKGVAHVGITAGASTPNHIVNQVKEYILESGK